MRSVAKHSYIKGASGKARAMAHVNYIQYRRGEDRENGKPREFFSQEREHIQGREVKRDIDRGERAMVVAHKLILSPGLQNVDMQKYTRDVLKETGREKGLDLDWRAVIHKNTDHDHAHVVVFGKDKNGRQVTFNREDYKTMREAGDRYLERNHFYERFLHRDSDRVMEKGYERDRGDNVFESLLRDLNRKDERELEPEKEKKGKQPREWNREQAIARLPEHERIRAGLTTYTKYSKLEDLKEYAKDLEAGRETRLPMEEYQKLYQWIGTKDKAGDDFYDRKAKDKWDKKQKKKDKDKERVPGEDEREFKKLDKDLKKSIKEMERGGSDFGKGHKQHLRETQGRLGDEHLHYTAAMEGQRIKDLMERFPDRKEELELQLQEIKRFDVEDRQVREQTQKWRDFDSMLGENWKTPEHDRDKQQEKTQTQTQNQGKEQTPGERQSVDQAVSTVHDQMAGDKTQEIERDDAEQLFERGGM